MCSFPRKFKSITLFKNFCIIGNIMSNPDTCISLHHFKNRAGPINTLITRKRPSSGSISNLNHSAPKSRFPTMQSFICCLEYTESCSFSINSHHGVWTSIQPFIKILQFLKIIHKVKLKIRV